MHTIERPRCVVPMTDEMRNMISWVSTELAHTPSVGEPGEDSNSIAKDIHARSKLNTAKYSDKQKFIAKDL